jgi:hypothetical protein
MKNTIFGTLIAAGALAATPALAQEMTPEAPTSTEAPATEAPAAEAPAAAEQAPPATLDSNGDGTMDAWDRNSDGKADAWDTDGDGQPDKADPMEEAATGE